MRSPVSINISVAQNPPIINILSQDIELVASLSYEDADKTQYLNDNETYIQYDWLYSSDNGQTFKQLNNTSSVLLIHLNSININFIYKLKVSINPPRSAIILNQKQNTEIFASLEDGILLTNQDADNSQILYSKNIFIDHNVDIENAIIDMAMNSVIEALEENGVVLDGLTSSEDLSDSALTENEENIPALPSIVTYGTNPPETNTQALLWSYCYSPEIRGACGYTAKFCSRSKHYNWALPSPCLTFEECSQFTQPSNCAFGVTSWSVGPTPVGSWKNTRISKVQSGWFSSTNEVLFLGWCDSASVTQKSYWTGSRSSALCGTYYNQTAPIFDPLGPTIPCKEGQVPCGQPIPNATVEGQLLSIIKCEEGWTGSKQACAPDTSKGFEARCAGRLYVWGNRIFCNSSDGGCKGDVAHYSDDYYYCAANAYYNEGYWICEEDGVKTFGKGGTDCDATLKKETLSSPVLVYSGHGLTAYASPGEANNSAADDPKILYAFGFGETDLQPGSYTLTLQDELPDNVEAATTVTAVVTNDGAGGECDVWDGVTSSKDSFSDCLNKGSSCITNVDPALRCLGSDRIYTREDGGTKSYVCTDYCDSPPYDPETNLAPVYIIKPEIVRPVIDYTPGSPDVDAQLKSMGFKTIAELTEEIENDADGDPYWLQVDTLSFQPGSQCNISCVKWRDYTETIKVKSGTTGKRVSGEPGLNNACKGCHACQGHLDCGFGCEACNGGRCLDIGEEANSYGYYHPCWGVSGGPGSANSECCVSFNQQVDQKYIECADKLKCETCKQITNPLNTNFGEYAGLNYEPDAQQGCCHGVVYDKQCYKCENNVVVPLCVAPEVCVETGTATYFDDNLIEREYITKECQIPPCDTCYVKGPTYATDGLCVHYDTTLDAELNCKTCSPIPNPLASTPLCQPGGTLFGTVMCGPTIPDYTSTLNQGEVCCQTSAESATATKNCCCDDPNNQYCYICDQFTTCCKGACATESECCGSSGIEPAPACQDCNGVDLCPSGYECCKKYDSGLGQFVFAGCANPSACEMCGNNYTGYGPILIPDYRAPGGYRTPDPCKKCSNGTVSPTTSDDPNDPCYSAATPQSIFYEP